MATLDSLKQAHREKAGEVTSSKQPLSDRQYSDGLEFLRRDLAYQGFVIPQLSQLLIHLFNSCITISVLEIGPGLKSIFGTLPYYLRCKVRRYVAFKPNRIFALRLGEGITIKSLNASTEIVWQMHICFGHRVSCILE